MTTISATLLNYRNALIELWNNYFLDNKDGVKNFQREVDFQFGLIQEKLFSALVAAKEFENELVPNALGCYDEIDVRIKPNLVSVQALYVRQQLQLNTEWAAIVLTQNGEDLFKFVEFFDWSTNEAMIGEYVKLILSDSKLNKNLIGKAFLVSPNEVEFFKL
jgi:hypothetical protein